MCDAEVIAVKVERKTCDVELGGETIDRAEKERGYTVALIGLETQQGVYNTEDLKAAKKRTATPQVVQPSPQAECSISIALRTIC
jgi:hypothetical protein